MGFPPREAHKYIEIRCLGVRKSRGFGRALLRSCWLSRCGHTDVCPTPQYGLERWEKSIVTQHSLNEQVFAHDQSSPLGTQLTRWSKRDDYVPKTVMRSSEAKLTPIQQESDRNPRDSRRVDACCYVPLMINANETKTVIMGDISLQ